jgi:hypothetical protein
MTTLTRYRTRPTYRQVLQSVRELSPADQRRLYDELVKLSGVRLERPAGTSAAVRRGRRLAKTIQAQLAASTGTLDEAMQRLRGRSWSQ